MAIAQRIESPSPTSSNGGDTRMALQGIMDRPHLPASLPWWMVWKIRLTKGWEPVTINKHIDSITMPKWVASAILVAFLGFAVTSWWRASDQRDILIELRTELKNSKDNEAAMRQEQKQLNADMQAWREVMNGRLQKIEGMLTQQQLNALERLQKSSQNNNQ